MRLVAPARTSKSESCPTRLVEHLHDEELSRGVGERKHDDDVLTQIPSDNVSRSSSFYFSEDCSSHGGGSPRRFSKQATLSSHEHPAPSTTLAMDARIPARLRHEVSQARHGTSEDAEEESPHAHICLSSIVTKPHELDDADASEVNVSPSARSGMRLLRDDLGTRTATTLADIRKDTARSPRRVSGRPRQELDDSDDTLEINMSPTARFGIRLSRDDPVAFTPTSPTDIKKDATQSPRRGRFAMVPAKDAQALHAEGRTSPTSVASPTGGAAKCFRDARVGEASDLVGNANTQKALYSALAETFDPPALPVQPPVEPLGRRRPCKRAVPLHPTDGNGPSQAWTS